MKLKPAALLFTLLVTAPYCKSQNVPIGQWTDYLSYQQGLTVCQAGTTMYCCCSSGVFSYNTSDNSLQRYNKITGLSDIGATVTRYNSTTNTVVIGYSDGNIDLLSNGRVINISDLKNSSAQGSKIINNIYFSNNFAYVSCGQGVMIIDLTQDIILDVCNIGAFGSALNVYATTICNDTIFAASVQGIYKVAVNDPDLQNYQDWQIVTQHVLPSGIYNGIVSCGAKMYASFSRRLTYPTLHNQYDTVYVYNNGIWSHTTMMQNHDSDNVYSLESSTVNNTPYLIYSGNYNINVLDTLGKDTIHIYDYGFHNPPAPSDAILDNTMNLWMADANYGLVKCPNDFEGQSYFPPGPFSNLIFNMAVQGSTIYLAPGGYNQSLDPEDLHNVGVSEYYNGTWYRLIENPTKDTIDDLYCVAIDPLNPQHAFGGSYGHGIVEYNNNAVVNMYDPSNSTLGNICTCYPGYVAGYYSARVGGVGVDTNGNLWAGNSGVQSNYLSVKKPNGTWQSFDFEYIANIPEAANVTGLLVTKSGAKWIIFYGNGILAYQDNGTFAQPTASNSILINDAVGNGGLPSQNIYCLAQDLNGAIWVGTDKQVVVFYSPDDVFNGPGGWDAQLVYVQQTGYTQYLMQGQFTTSIAIDGGNRKWIGTLGGGAFLMSADGTQQILNFTTDNSPLLSNNILSISINQLTGEVFFATDEGLVSYRGDATQGNNSFSNVYAYPDPVPHGYSGPIAIKNLVTNTDVKITNVSGEIVYHTVALGGQAIWYGTNFSGQRVQTGVYMVFCTSPDGSQSFVTKLLLVN